MSSQEVSSGGIEGLSSSSKYPCGGGRPRKRSWNLPHGGKRAGKPSHSKNSLGNSSSLETSGICSDVSLQNKTSSSLGEFSTSEPSSMPRIPEQSNRLESSMEPNEQFVDKEPANQDFVTSVFGEADIIEAEKSLKDFLDRNSEVTNKKLCKVYIQGVADSCNLSEMSAYFEEHFGKVNCIDSVLGLATITFEQRKAGMEAIKHLGGQGFHIRLWDAPDLDESNVYFSHLPKAMGETDLSLLVEKWAPVLTTKIMRNGVGSTGSGFTRLHNAKDSPKVIRALNGAKLAGSDEPIEARLAFRGSKRDQNGPSETTPTSSTSKSQCPTGYFDQTILDPPLTTIYQCDSGFNIADSEGCIPIEYSAMITGVLLPEEYQESLADRVQWLQRDGTSQPLVFFFDKELPILGVYEPDSRVYLGRVCDAATLKGCEIAYEVALSGHPRPQDNYPAIPTHFRVVVPPQYCYQPAKDVYWKFIEGAYRPIIEYESDAGLLPLMGIWQKTEPITGNAFFYGRPISWRAARENCGFHLPTPIETTHFWPKPDSTRTHASDSEHHTVVYYEEFGPQQSSSSPEISSQTSWCTNDKSGLSSCWTEGNDTTRSSSSAFAVSGSNSARRWTTRTETYEEITSTSVSWSEEVEKTEMVDKMQNS